MNASTENNTGKGIHIFSTNSGPLLFLDYVNDKTIHISCDCRRQIIFFSVKNLDFTAESNRHRTRI